MRNITILSILALAGCSAAQTAQMQTALSSPAGQLFCAIQVSGGGAVVAGLVDAEASALVPGAAPIAILATGATKSFVDSACKAAGGVPVIPPSNPTTAPQIAVIVPKAS
jgi:hypothetical protein